MYGVIPTLPAAVAATSATEDDDAARAAGENAGANNRMAVSITERMSRSDPFVLRSSWDVH